MPELTLNDPRIAGVLERLTLEEKVLLLTGRDFWSTWPVEHVGLRSIVFSDGPSGVRGPVWDERSPSLNLPSGTALASSWDPDVAYRYGMVAALEARRKGVDVVLGPTINLHRSPLGGRHFECFSEDPVLTAQLATGYVAGCQSQGVGATPKHYVANDWETDRFTAGAEVSARVLRELYLCAFEGPVRQSRPWMVMSSYNSINGVTASEHELLRNPLKGDWEFDGVVVSDWGGVRSLASASAAQDLAMPGPEGPWGDALVRAVRDGEISESAVDEKVRRILLLAARVGALEEVSTPAQQPAVAVDGVAFAREAAVEGMVLLENDGVLPLQASSMRRIAVMGQNAEQARTQGGGSATVLPERVVSPLEGIRKAFSDAQVTYTLGAVAHDGLSPIPLEEMTDPVTGEPGALVRFLDQDRAELFTEHRRSTALVYFGGDAPVADAVEYEVVLDWKPSTGGPVHLGFEAVGAGAIELDGEVVLEATSAAVSDQLGASLLHPPAVRATVHLEEGRTVRLRLRFDMRTRDRMMAGVFALTLGTAPVPRENQQLIDDAVQSARAADVAVVVVGTSSKEESEGFDRTSLALPGRQDELVNAVAATGTSTVVVVNTGAPVLLPWRGEVAAVLLGYFGGQAMGDALADVLSGTSEPGGRLPTTWADRQEDVPVLDVTPHDGVLRYDEGLHIGYRAWLRAEAAPAYWFGHGLGYTTWSISHPSVDYVGGGVVLHVKVTNTGMRAGKQVVQAYLSREESAVDRPVRWLAGHAVVRAEAGSTTPVTIEIPARAFAHWDESLDAWVVEPGQFALLVGTSAVELPHCLGVTQEAAQAVQPTLGLP